jgi:hypothetical protein
VFLEHVRAERRFRALFDTAEPGLIRTARDGLISGLLDGRWRDAYRKDGAAGLQRTVGRPPARSHA